MGDAALTHLESSQACDNDARLASLRTAGGERFDAAGWRYLDTLARRSAAHEGSVRRLLALKLRQAMDAFDARFEKARADAAMLLATTCEQHPHAAAEMERRFAVGDFKGMRQLQASLQAREQCAALAGLVSRLEPALAGAHPRAAESSVPALANAAPTLELKTVRESRATWARMSVDRQLSRAMQQAPQNAGPINSHMLILRSLEMMQAISPDYLSRVVSYVDALLSLDPGEKEVAVKRKKVAPAKTAKQKKVVRK